MKMEQYVGIKLVKATPMNRIDYNTYRGWTMPSNENGADAGYLIEYEAADGNPSNDDRHEGHITWTPARAFEASHRQTNAWWGLIWTLLRSVLSRTQPA